MDLVRVRAPFARLADVVALTSRWHVLFQCSDADTVIALASIETPLERPIGAWLEVDDDYLAQLAARDVATLSHVVALDAVVVASATLARERAALLVAMLSDDRIDLRNDAATIVGAYNRPAPPSPITVWGWDGTVLAGAEGERRVTSSTLVDGLEVTTFASA